MEFLSLSPKNTQEIAGELAKKILKGSPSTSSGRARIIGLEGELGVGKTVFVKGFAKALKIKESITSPTFVIMKCFKLPADAKALAGRQASSFKNLYHIDAFRLKDEKDLLKLGIKEIFKDPQNIVLIEWAERVRKIIPRNATWIHIDHVGENIRQIVISSKL